MVIAIHNSWLAIAKGESSEVEMLTIEEMDLKSITSKDAKVKVWHRPPVWAVSVLFHHCRVECAYSP